MQVTSGAAERVKTEELQELGNISTPSTLHWMIA